jgi:sulfite exporter TauE/SafE
VSVYADRLRKQEDTNEGTLTPLQVRQHILFNLGRTLGYAAIGMLLATLGAVAVDALDVVLSVGDSIRATTAILAGGFIVTTGISYIGGSPTHVSLGPIDDLFGRVSRILTRYVDDFVGDARIAGLGLVHALLPCPITYPAYIYAFALGDPLRGGFLLALVGLGTFPTLLVYGTVFGSLSASKHLHRVLGLAFVVLGYLMAAHGLDLLGIGVPRISLPLPSPTYQPLG